MEVGAVLVFQMESGVGVKIDRFVGKNKEKKNHPLYIYKLYIDIYIGDARIFVKLARVLPLFCRICFVYFFNSLMV